MLSSFSTHSLTGVSMYSVSVTRAITLLMPALIISLLHLEQGVALLISSRFL
jgi:hypothetical protein